MKMESTRFLRFILMFIMLHARNSTALITHQDKNKAIIAKEDVLARAKSGLINVHGGRKMMLKMILKKEMKKVEVLKTEDTKISNASIFVESCKRGILSGKCKLMSYRIISHPLQNKMVSFTTFSADYHVPKSHPPKNNR